MAIMLNTPSDDFGDHSQKAHDWCQREFETYKKCALRPANDKRFARGCIRANNDFMNCLERTEPTPAPCCLPLYNHRMCRFDRERDNCETMRALFRQCKLDPPFFQKNVRLERFDEDRPYLQEI